MVIVLERERKASSPEDKIYCATFHNLNIPHCENLKTQPVLKIKPCKTICQIKYFNLFKLVILKGNFSVCIAHELWLRQQPKLGVHGQCLACVMNTFQNNNTNA
jgi:hypothetical protein